jgi:hypothetical protein
VSIVLPSNGHRVYDCPSLSVLSSPDIVTGASVSGTSVIDLTKASTPISGNVNPETVTKSVPAIVNDDSITQTHFVGLAGVTIVQMLVTK